MTLHLELITTGQLGNNVCVLFDETSKKAVVIDPSFEPQPVLQFIQENQLEVESIWLTHGHFDHFAGIEFLNAHLQERPKLGLHNDDLDLLRDGGGSKYFHFPIPIPEDPDLYFEDGQELFLGTSSIQVRHAPGHSQGSVIFYIAGLSTAICGDVIFYHGVGRTDLAGGNHQTLVASIRNQVLTLPPKTRLIPGHGEETSVEEEMLNNPFL